MERTMPRVAMKSRVLPTACTGAGAVIVLAATVLAPDTVARLIRSVCLHVTARNALAFAAAVSLIAVVGPLRRAAARLAAPTVPAWRRFGAQIDATPWTVSVTAIAVVAGAAWYAVGRATAFPHVLGDELIHANLARALAQSGSLATHGYGLTTSALDAIAYLATANDVSAYRLIQLMNVIVMVSAAAPAYLLARRVTTHRWALVAAALTVTVPWMSASSLVMTEPIFYPVFLLFALALVRALERPTVARQLVLAVALGLAFATRTQAIVLAGAVVTAVLIHGQAQRRLRSVLRAFAATWALYAACLIVVVTAWATDVWNPLGSYTVLVHWYGPLALTRWTASNVTALCLSLGVLAVIAFPLGAAALLRRGSSRAEQAVAATAVSTAAWLALTVAVLSASSFGLGGIHERNLFYVAPLFFICAIAWGSHGFPRPVLLTAAIAAVLTALALVTPSHLVSPATDSVSFRLWTQLGHDTRTTWLLLVAAVLVGVVAIVRLRSLWPLVLAVALASVGGAAASDFHSDQPRSTTPRTMWLDRARTGSADPAIRDAEVTILWIGLPRESCPIAPRATMLGQMALYTELFNSRVNRVGHLLADNGARGVASETFTLSSGGVVRSRGAALQPGLVVADARVQIVGTKIASLTGRDLSFTDGPRDDALALWRVSAPLRLADPSQLLDRVTRQRLACS
jgi:hypothetical protein